MHSKGDLKMSRLEKIKKQYVGKWIAIRGKEIIAVDSDYHELHKSLREKNVKEVMVIHSPSPEERKVEFLL